jgi:hypothetical protein
MWSNTTTAPTDFPRLIRRLILETAPGVVQLGFPAGEGILLRGWDGTVRATQGTAYVPAGLSLWELSTRKSPGVKAQRDYDNRGSTPDGSPTRKATYIAATARPWPDREDWASTRSADERWKRVRAIGLDDIEAWLETAPVTHAWISQLIGLHPFGMLPAETWWNDWSPQTNPAIKPELVLAGRSREAEGMVSILGQAPRVTTIRGPSLEEVIAFIAAVAVNADAQGQGQTLARMALVDEPAAWRSLLLRPGPLVLVPRTEGLVGELPSSTTHHILVPVVGTVHADVALPPIDPTEAAAALREDGMEERRADEAGRLARRSLIALRRHIAEKPELHMPRWGRPPVSRAQRGILLAGRWSDRPDGDREALAALTAENYDTLAERLAGMAGTEDPFVAIVDGSWALFSPYDAWLVLRGHIRDEDLKRLEEAVKQVLAEIDPALDLPPGERWKASIEGKLRVHSADLRHGLAEALALLGIHGHEIALPYGSDGTNWAGYLVRELFEAANKDAEGKLWTSLSELLPLLAEASPDRFLQAVRDGLQGAKPVLAKIFQDSGSGGLLAPTSPHTGLLWAIEVVAWSPEHFGQAVDLLARLDELDPGGRLSNRPAGSLADIFCPWHPENAVNVERRLAVLDALRRRHPDAAWKLMLSMLPTPQGIHSPTAEPVYRDWKPLPTPVLMAEYVPFVGEVVTRVLEDAGTGGGRWAQLVQKLADLPPDDRRRVLDALKHLVDDNGLAADDAEVIWKQLHELVERHSEYSDAAWALPADEVDGIRKVANKMVPTDARSRHSWLFADQMPHLGDPTRRTDHAAYEQDLAGRRREAVREIEATGDLELVRRVAAESVVPWAVGIALADALGDKYDNTLLTDLSSDQPARLDLAYGYFARRFENANWSWLEALIANAQTLSPDQHARLLLATHDFPKAWEVADEDAEVASHFWKWFRAYGLGQGFHYLDVVAERLMRAGRNAAALDLLGIYLERAATEVPGLADLIAKGLEGFLPEQTADPDYKQLSGWDFERLFEFLEGRREEVGEARLAQLEWAYLQVLGLEPKVPTLHDAMTTDPAFFVQIISTVFRAANADEQSDEEMDEARTRRATNAYHLLGSWRTPPGSREDGTLDPEHLKAWTGKALELLAESDRLEVGELYIGQVLQAANPDPDGLWPPAVIRDLLEDIQSERIERGLSLAVSNRRGMTTRALDEGGRQERELASSYRTQADQVADQWPRTAAIMRGLAESYEADARREDAEAERFRRGQW